MKVWTVVDLQITQIREALTDSLHPDVCDHRWVLRHFRQSVDHHQIVRVPLAWTSQINIVNKFYSYGYAQIKLVLT